MNRKFCNSLIVIENGQLIVYNLDDRISWNVGRPTKENHPDIQFRSTTVSRQHCKFENEGGFWLYKDNNGKNGTVYNGKHIQASRDGSVWPIMLEDKDVLIFGGGDEAIINSKTIWAMYREYQIDTQWRVADTKSMTHIEFSNGENVECYSNPQKGMAVFGDTGMAIYMGDVTYLCGEMCVRSIDA